jgi:ribonuclease BN (tRNA processing enzyme)
MREIVVLGGGRDAAGCYAGSSYALVSDERTYLLDCGEASAGRMSAFGVNAMSVRAAFITHMHYDHMAGLFNFLFGVWAFCRREEEVPVGIREWASWGRLSENALPTSLRVAVPQGAVQSLEQFLPTMYLARELWRFDFGILPIHPGLFYTDDRLRVSAYPNGHLSSQPANQQLLARYPWLTLESYSLKAEMEGLRLVYSGDLALETPAGSDELRPIVQDADIIISEVAHVIPEYHLDMLARTSARKIILVHIHKNLRPRVESLIAARGDQRFICAENGMHIAL